MFYNPCYVFLNWSPPKFSKYNSLYNLWHFKKFRASLHGTLYLKNVGGLQLKKHPVASAAVSVVDVSTIVASVAVASAAQ